MKKILGLTVAAMLVMGLVGGGTWAYFSDPETSTGNVLTAGTLDLDIGGGDANVVILQANITDVAPGVSASDSTLLAISGTLAGELDITMTSIDSEENSIIVDAESVGGPDTTSAAGEGELDANTWIAFWLDYQNNGFWDVASDTGLKSDGTTYNFSAPLLSDTATSGSTTTVVKTAAGWTPDAYKGYPVTVTGLGTRVVTGNTADTITVATPFTGAVTTQTFSVADGPHYDLASAYNGDVFDAAIASMADTYDFNVEWVVPVTVGNIIMSDTLDIDLTFTLEQAAAD